MQLVHLDQGGGAEQGVGDRPFGIWGRDSVSERQKGLNQATHIGLDQVHRPLLEDLIGLDFEKLVERFKDKYAQQSIWNLLIIGKNHRKWIYQRGDTYYTYKKTVIKVLNPNDWDLDFQ